MSQQRILLVEDIAVVALAERELLRKLGYDVVTARNGEKAIEMMRSIDSPVDLVLMDIDVGKCVDCSQAAQIIRQQFEVPVVFLSSRYDPETVSWIELIGAHGFLAIDSDESVQLNALQMAFRLNAAQRAFEESERKFDSALGGLGLGLWDWNIELDSVTVSERWAEILGYSLDELLPISFATMERLMHPGSFASLEALIAQHWSGESDQIDAEIRMRQKDGHWIWVQMRGKVTERDRENRPLRMTGTYQDITDRKHAELLMQARFRLSQFAVTHSLHEVLVATLDEAGQLTDSPIGFYHFLDDDQKTLTLQAWSTMTTKDFCKAEGQGRHYNIDEAGVWVDCVRERRPVIHNDYPSLKHKKGLPAGHAIVKRELAVPVMRGGKIVAVLGVGNKDALYNDRDLSTVGQLADMAWDVALHKRAEEELHQSLELKEVLLKELQHRVKNNLNVVASLIGLELTRLTDEHSRQIFLDARSRIHSMVKIYEQLYQSNTMGEVDFGRYVGDLARELLATYDIRPDAVRIVTELADVRLDVKRAVPLGLILNELISNSLKYAHPNGQEGKMCIRLARNNGNVALEVEDDGVGLPEDFDSRAQKNMGIKLVGMLVEQIDGEMKLSGSGGTCVTVTFPA